MDEEYISIKIRDGLFLGNKHTAADLEFLLANRFKYVLNCTAEVKNYFESSGYIKYMKLKYSRSKPEQPLWKENLKKLHRMVEFVDAADEEAECCLIHSNEGNNRCIAVALAYLMVRYKWRFLKALQFLESKNIENRLGENFVRQLRGLEEIISEENIMSIGWAKEGLDDEELILTNTYLNTIEIPYKKEGVGEKGGRRIQWRDKLEKQEKQ